MTVTNMADADKMPSVPPPRVADNSFLAILHGTERKQIMIDENEYAILKAIREMVNTKRHCKILIGYQDGKLMLYDVNLADTYGK